MVRSLADEGRKVSDNIMDSVVIKQEVEEDLEDLIPVQTVKEQQPFTISAVPLALSYVSI